MKICPLCEYGTIIEAIIKVTKERIYLCEECEALWKDSIIDLDKVLNFEDFMLQRNLKPLWKELEIVGEIE